MAFAVSLTPTASKELDAVVIWYDDQKFGIGEEWFRGIQEAIATLAENPKRFGITRESDSFPYELRELLYGSGRRKTHRVLFRVTEVEVVVLGIRHMAQQDLSTGDL